MNENRQPKGTPIGGQFAASAHRAGTVTLDAPREVEPVATITDEHRERYGNGSCGELAAALHRRTGWPVVLVQGIFDDDSRAWSHALVQTPDGTYLDVTGANESGYVFDAWAPDGMFEENGLVLEDVVIDAVALDDPLLRLGTVDEETEAVAARLVADYPVHRTAAEFTAGNDDVDLWRQHGWGLTADEEARVLEMGARQMSERFVELAAANGHDADVVTAGAGARDPGHQWAVVDGVNVDWTARQFHEFDPARPHYEIPCPLVWHGDGHPIIDPR